MKLETEKSGPSSWRDGRCWWGEVEWEGEGRLLRGGDRGGGGIRRGTLGLDPKIFSKVSIKNNQMKKIPARISDLLFITKSFLLQFVVLKDGSIYTRIDSRTIKIHHSFIWPVCQYSRRSESAIMANRFERLAKPDESVGLDKSRLFLFFYLWISKKHGLFFSLVKAVNHVQSFRFAS